MYEAPETDMQEALGSLQRSGILDTNVLASMGEKLIAKAADLALAGKGSDEEGDWLKDWLMNAKTSAAVKGGFAQESLSDISTNAYTRSKGKGKSKTSKKASTSYRNGQQKHALIVHRLPLPR